MNVMAWSDLRLGRYQFQTRGQDDPFRLAERNPSLKRKEKKGLVGAGSPTVSVDEYIV